MEIDLEKVLGPMDRTVRRFDRDGHAASAVTLTRLYDTTVEDLWDAVTSPDRLPRWFLPVEGDLQIGGRYQFQGNAGGTITACEPPRRFAATWEFGGDVTWIEVRLTREGDQARLTLEHTALMQDHWTQFGPGAVGIGWDMGLMGLLLHLDSGAALDQTEVFGWMASPQGMAFVAQSGEAWRAADVAAGEAPAEAKARSDRTIAFFQGAPPPDVAHPGTGS